MRLAYERKAVRALARLPRALRDRIVSKIEAYAADPSAFRQVIALSGRPGRRLRVGDYRVIFRIDGDLVVIEGVGHRSEVYED